MIMGFVIAYRTGCWVKEAYPLRKKVPSKLSDRVYESQEKFHTPTKGLRPEFFESQGMGECQWHKINSREYAEFTLSAFPLGESRTDTTEDIG